MSTIDQENPEINDCAIVNPVIDALATREWRRIKARVFLDARWQEAKDEVAHEYKSVRSDQKTLLLRQPIEYFFIVGQKKGSEGVLAPAATYVLQHEEIYFKKVKSPILIQYASRKAKNWEALINIAQWGLWRILLHLFAKRLDKQDRDKVRRDRINESKRHGNSHTKSDVGKQYMRQQGKCYYCGAVLGTDWQKDHKQPIGRYGDDSIANIAITCLRCNVIKGSKTEREFREYLGFWHDLLSEVPMEWLPQVITGSDQLYYFEVLQLSDDIKSSGCCFCNKGFEVGETFVRFPNSRKIHTACFDELHNNKFIFTIKP